MSQFYLDAGDYSAFGANTTGSSEPLTDGERGDPGFPRALTTTYPELNIFFQLTDDDVNRGDEYEIIADMVLPRTFEGAVSTHDLTFAINGVTIGSATAITSEVVVVHFSRAATNLTAGSNVFTITRTGDPVPWPTNGPGSPTADPTVAWTQFDTLSLGAVNPVAELPFQILSVASSVDEATITWVSEEGVTYTIESSDDLINWIEEETGFPAGELPARAHPTPSNLFSPSYPRRNTSASCVKSRSPKASSRKIRSTESNRK